VRADRPGADAGVEQPAVLEVPVQQPPGPLGALMLRIAAQRSTNVDLPEYESLVRS
jgi:hypothetical protein